MNSLVRGIKHSNRMRERTVFYLLLAACCLSFVFLGSCSSQKEKVFRKSTILMDTMVSISVVAESGDEAEKAIERAFSEIGKLDGLLNFFSGQSEVSMINRNAGISPVKVSPETLFVIEKAVFVSEKTGGAFDPTIGPEISLWDFSAGKKPDDTSIRERLGLVNYRLIAVDREGASVFLRKKGMLLDLGGIAKGYAADKAVEELKKDGVKAGLVSVAGDIRAFGLKPDRSAWSIGIRNPRSKGKDDEIMANLKLTDRAISTSGDYERYFISDNIRYHHLLDPKTGYPAGGCRSVSVVAGEGVYVDAFSTAIFVLGPEKGIELLRQMGFEGVIVDKDGKIHTTPGLGRTIEFERNL